MCLAAVTQRSQQQGTQPQRLARPPTFTHSQSLRRHAEGAARACQSASMAASLSVSPMRSSLRESWTTPAANQGVEVRVQIGGLGVSYTPSIRGVKPWLLHELERKVSALGS